MAEVLRLTLQETPADGSTHWTTRTMATRVGIGKDSVARIWSDHNLKPWKVESQCLVEPDNTALLAVIGDLA